MLHPSHAACLEAEATDWNEDDTQDCSLACLEECSECFFSHRCSKAVLPEVGPSSRISLLTGLEQADIGALIKARRYGVTYSIADVLIMLAQVEIRLREMPLQDGSSLWDQVEDILQTKLQRLQERLEEDA